MGLKGPQREMGDVREAGSGDRDEQTRQVKRLRGSSGDRKGGLGEEVTSGAEAQRRRQWLEPFAWRGDVLSLIVGRRGQRRGEGRGVPGTPVGLESQAPASHSPAPVSAICGVNQQMRCLSLCLSLPIIHPFKNIRMSLFKKLNS